MDRNMDAINAERDTNELLTNELERVAAERDRLLTLATKWCPQEHHDWQEILRISKGSLGRRKQQDTETGQDGRQQKSLAALEAAKAYIDVAVGDPDATEKTWQAWQAALAALEDE
jgi:hypothetical protein